MSGVSASLLASLPDFGDWQAEYRALTEACALSGRADRGAVRVAGERRAEMLNGLLTNRVTELGGAGRHAMLLTAKGRVLSDLRVFPGADHLLLDVPRRGLDNLLAAFKKYLPPIYATFEDVSEELVQLGIYGPQSVAAASRALGAELPAEHLGLKILEREGAPLFVIRNRWLAGDGVEVITLRDAAPRLAETLRSAVDQASGRLVGSRVLEVARVESGIPDYGIDVSEDNLPQETSLEEVAISYDKGCYLGQEVVARIHFRGHVNRHLWSLKFDDEPPPAGARLHDGDKEVGTVTSALTSPEYGAIGLGYVRREVEPPAKLRWSHGAVEGGVVVREAPFRRRSV